MSMNLKYASMYVLIDLKWKIDGHSHWKANEFVFELFNGCISQMPQFPFYTPYCLYCPYCPIQLWYWIKYKTLLPQVRMSECPTTVVNRLQSASIHFNGIAYPRVFFFLFYSRNVCMFTIRFILYLIYQQQHSIRFNSINGRFTMYPNVSD